LYTQEKFEIVYTQNYRLVKSFCARFVGPRSRDLEDLTQEVFIKAFINISRFRAEESSIKTWICSIARNHCLDFLRSKYNQTTVLIEEPEFYFKNRVASEEELEIKKQTDKIFAIIKNLDKESIKIMTLRFVEDKTLVEISKILKCSNDNVRQKSSRALKYIRNNINRKKS